MKDFIVIYNDEDYRLLSMNDIKNLLKKEYKEFIVENAKELEREAIKDELNDLLMIENCTNMVTIERMLNSYGYSIIDLNDVRKGLDTISDYLYYHTDKKETEIFNRIEQVKNDIAYIMNEEV